MSENQEYYGIKFNGEIPKIDEINKYSKEVEIEFEGNAYLVEREDEEVEKIEIENGYKLKKEGEYEIEFTNLENETYNLQVRIDTNFFFILLPFFAIGVILLFLLWSPVKDVSRFFRFINLAVLELQIDEAKEVRYEFDVDFRNISSAEISLSNTINAESVAKNKIAPRSKWKFFNNN